MRHSLVQLAGLIDWAEIKRTLSVSFTAVRHAPEVECIAKGKACMPYEFCVKVSVATTLKEGLMVGMRSMPSNPYDGHTLVEQLEQMGILFGSNKLPHTAIVNRGCRGVGVKGVCILRSGQLRGITKTLKAMI